MSTSHQETVAAAIPAALTVPDVPRVLYQQNPLAQVICQLRFPSVLRVDAELPAGFQDKVREKLPVYREAEIDGLPPGIQQMPDEVLNLLRLAAKKKPRTFASLDGAWEVTLNKDALALATTSYQRWEEFRRHLDLAVNALHTEYSPALYTRIGLRYRNLIKRSELNLGEAAWGELLRHHLAGELVDTEVEASVESAARYTVFRLPQFGAKVGMRHGLVLDGNEMCYGLDNDFYIESNTECGNAVDVLQFFSKQAHRLFRWCISDRLHDAMGPRPLE